MSYKTELLEYVAEVASGGGAPQGQDLFSESGTPFVRAGSLPLLLKGVKEESLELLTDEVARNHRLRLFPKDTVLFAKSGMSATKGHIYQLKNPCYVVNHLAAIIPTEKVAASYLKYWFQVFSPSQLIQDEAYPSIRLYDIKKIEIPLPPLPEQKRIAEVLDKADALRQKRRLALQKLNTLLQSVFLEMFGDPVKNPKGWDLSPVSSFVSQFQGGKSILSESSENFDCKFRVLKVSAVTELIYKPEQSKPVPLDYNPPPEHFARQDDLLFSRANTSELVGAVAYVWQTPNNLLLPDKLWRFVWKDKNNVNPLYIWAVFTNKSIKYELGKLGTGTSGSMKNISQGKLMSMKVPFPDIHLQNKFGDFVRKHHGLLNKLSNASIQTENLFQSLQQKAFKGELFNGEFQAVESQEEKVWHQTSLF